MVEGESLIGLEKALLIQTLVPVSLYTFFVFLTFWRRLFRSCRSCPIDFVSPVSCRHISFSDVFGMSCFKTFSCFWRVVMPHRRVSKVYEFNIIAFFCQHHTFFSCTI